MAGFGVIKALIRPHDHVIMDHVSHNCLQEGAISATKNLKKFTHLDQNEMLAMLK
jgi:glycine C-acetyltransferase